VVEELNAAMSAGAEVGVPPELVRQLASRMEFVPLTAREPLPQSDEWVR
jgi:hypothetical protein